MGVEKILVGIIGGLFQVLATSIIVFKIINTKQKFLNILFSILISIYFTISILFIPNQFRFVLFVIVLILLMYFVLKERSRLILLYAFVPVLLLSISEIVISLLLVIFGIDSKLIVNNYLYNLLANILISIFAVVLVNFKPLQKLYNKILDVFKKNTNLIKYLYLFLGVLYLITLKNGLEFILKSNYYVNVFFIIGMVLILTIIIKNEFKAEQLREQNQQMLNYVTKYEKIITEQGKANHEFKNQLMVIRGYAQMASPKLLEYLDSIMDDFNKTSSSYLISQLNKFPDGGIKGLLYYKLSIIEDEKIKYDISVENGIKTRLNNLPINDYKNITKILGVLLDNAIDASKKCKNKNILIYVIKEKNNVIFKIYNTYKGKIDISKIGSGYTTKGNSHGYGLKLVKDIIDSNSIYNLENMLEDKYYVSILKVYIKSKKK